MFSNPDRHTVRLVVRPHSNYWFLKHGGKMGLDIKKATGSNITATPFPLVVPPSEVQRVVMSLEPGVVIL